MTVTAFNMHTDLVIDGGPAGSVTLTADDAGGHEHRVTLSQPIAQRLHDIAGGAAFPSGPSGGGGGAEPFNMHTDNQTKITAPDDNTIVIAGPGTRAGVDYDLKITIYGPARQELSGSQGGL